MLKKLRRRLAVIFTLFTGSVLAAALAIAFSRSVTQIRTNGDELFLNKAARVTVGVNSTTTQETQEISGFSISGAEDLIVAARADDRATQTAVISGQGESGGLPSQTLEGLLSEAKSTAEANSVVGRRIEGNLYISHTDDYADDSSSDAGVITGTTYVLNISSADILDLSDTFELRYGGANYRATYFTLAEPTGNIICEVAVLEDTAGQTRQIWLDGLWMLLIFLAGLALLFLANWLLAGLVLRSTAEGLRRQTEFVAAASHELRSPLAVIRASLSAAEEAARDADSRQAEKFGAAALGEAERMGRLVDDLLLLAGGDAGSWQLHSAPVDLDTLLIDAAESHRPLAKAKGLRLELSLPDETLPQPSGDAERLRQILAVLLDNALQYAPKGSAVTLAARTQKGKVSLSVADCGPGIPDEEKPRVFERFYRIDKSRHDKAHAGLGLAVARELAALHKGQLAASDTEGGGATFTLTLPLG